MKVLRCAGATDPIQLIKLLPSVRHRGRTTRETLMETIVVKVRYPLTVGHKSSLTSMCPCVGYVLQRKLSVNHLLLISN